MKGVESDVNLNHIDVSEVTDMRFCLIIAHLMGTYQVGCIKCNRYVWNVLGKSI